MATAYEEEFSAVGGDETFTLGATPETNANMLSGVSIFGVTVNGVGLQYSAAPSERFEYGYTAPTSIVCKALTASDVVTVFFGVA